MEFLAVNRRRLSREMPNRLGAMIGGCIRRLEIEPQHTFCIWYLRTLYWEKLDHVLFCELMKIIFLNKFVQCFIWSEGNCYPSSLYNRYPAIYVCCQINLTSCKALHNQHFSSCKKHFVDNLLNNKTILSCSIQQNII